MGALDPHRGRGGAIRFLIERSDADGPFNLTAPAPLTNRDFTRELGRALSRPSFAPAPGFALRFLLGEMADALLHGQRAVPERLLDLGYSSGIRRRGGRCGTCWGRRGRLPVSWG